MQEAVTASLEAVLTRSADSALEKIAAARAAIESVIFGQQEVMRNIGRRAFRKSIPARTYATRSALIRFSSSGVRFRRAFFKS
jgi:ElaB/YqjD/DUF883 family membrane-anchored ribosome-binding protein